MKKVIKVKAISKPTHADYDHDPGSCPVARACKRAGIKDPWVSFYSCGPEQGLRMYYGDDSHDPEHVSRRFITLPDAVAQHVGSFDANGVIGAFDFEIEIPD